MTYHPVEARSDVVLSVVVSVIFSMMITIIVLNTVSLIPRAASAIWSHHVEHIKKKNNQDICERPKLFIMKGFVLE